MHDMTDLPDRPVQRLRKPSWRDSRLVAGVLLVLATTVLGSLVVARADDRVPVYVAADTLLPGDRLTADRLERRDVQLDGSMPAYLAADRAIPADSYLVRAVKRGELVPMSALVGQSQVDVQTVTLLVDATSARPLVKGSVVDVYANARRPDGGPDDFAGPKLLLEKAVVAATPEESQGFGARSDVLPVRALVPIDKVAAVIRHLDSGSRITVVPVAGSDVRAGS
jgi:hypothetical protein